MSQRIPKIIHQSWKDEHIPYDIYRKHWVDSWKLVYPDWTWKFWTDADNDALVRTHYPIFYRFYRSLTPNIKKADFSRFLYMHQYGGVYVDLDFMALKHLGPLLAEYDVVLGKLSDDNDYYQIPNAFMASTPGLDFWLKTARDAMHAPPHERSVEKHAGPFRLQWAFYKYQPANAIVYSDTLIYPFDWIHFTHWENKRYFRADRMHLAQRLASQSMEEIAAIFPQAYCLTFWTSNW